MVPVLAIGVGMFVLAIASGTSALLLYTDSANAAITMHNIGVLVAGIPFLLTSPVGLFTTPWRLSHERAIAIYAALVLSAGLLYAAVRYNALPPFFIPGAGFTHVRGVVLGSAILCFGLAAISWWQTYAPTRLPFVRWHAAGLALFTLGLVGVMLEGVPGDAVSWLGRGAQFLAGPCFLAAVWSAGRERGFAAALIQSALPYRPLVESTSEGIVVLDRQGTLFYCNEAARRLFGYAAHEPFGANLFDLPLPSTTRDYLRNQLAASTEERLEIVLAHRSGATFPAELTAYLNPAAAERLQVWSIHDISKRKQAEAELARYQQQLEAMVQERTEALRASEERFRILLTSTPDHIVEQDRDLRYTLVINPQLGLMAEQMLGKTDADFVPAADAERLTAIKRQVLELEQPAKLEVSIPSRRGGEEFFEGSYVPKHNAEGKVDGLIGYFRNVTERKRAEQALRESEQRFRSLFSTMSEGFALHEIVCDDQRRPIDYRFLEVNDAFIRLTGLAREKVVGRTVREVLPATEDHWIETYGRVALTGVPAHVERYHAQLGRHFDVVAYAPAPRLFAVVFMDVTEAKQRTAELEAANKELESFAYSVSHDLRSPLRAIDGFTQLLYERYEAELDAEGKRLFGVVRKNTRRMARLIDDMLHFSRVGRTPMKAEAIDMERLAREVVAELKPTNRAVEVEVGRLPWVSGDEAMLRQVWVNLLANAFKFTTPVTPTRIEVGCTASGEEPSFYVRDNGVGFDMAYADKLLGIFQRLHSTDEFEGTGIGLALVERIVKRHGGCIIGLGEVGKGAEFRFTLPVRDKSSMAPPVTEDCQR